MRVDIDATQVARRLIHSHVQIPVSGGRLTLSYPLWNPGDHAPIQNVGQIGSLTFHAAGKVLPWRRDLVDLDAFHVDVPQGSSTIDADFDFFLPAPGEAFADSSAHLLVLRWSLYTLYIAGQPVRGIPVEASLTLPKGWQWSTALPLAQVSGNTLRFQPASLETVVDSPVLAAQFMRRIELTHGEPFAHELDVAAERESDLPAPQDVAGIYARLIQQAQRMFGSEHYRGYRFLVAASDYTTPGSGFEHSESSDNRVPADFFREPRRTLTMGDLLPHEYAHSWNGKYRRPADLYPVDYQQPERTDLLWVYESLTDYLGVVLATRSGFRSEADSRECWAAIAAKVDHETGRTWRNMQDTADSVPLTMNELFFAPPGWSSWLRMLDYYDEGALLWLEANEIIVEQTHGQRSLDDFLHRFYAGENGTANVSTYTEDDVFRALDAVAPYDWRGFFRERLTSHAPHAPLGGLERSGWTLVYTAEPNTFIAAARPNGLGSTMNSIGLLAGNDGTVADVVRGGPCDAAGMVPGMKIVTVNGQPWSPAGLLAAISMTAHTPAAIRFETMFAGVSQEFSITYAGGPRYPHLQRIAGRADDLTKLLAPHPAVAP